MCTKHLLSKLTYKGVEKYFSIYFDSSNFMDSFQMTILLFSLHTFRHFYD